MTNFTFAHGMTEAEFTDMMAFLKDAATWSDFAASILEQVNGGRRLSEKQRDAVLRMKAKVEAKRAAPKLEAAPASYRRIGALMAQAGDTLKYPKVRLETEDGQKVVLGLTGKGYIAVTDGGPFGDNVFFGRIDLDGQANLTGKATPAVRALLDEVEKDPEGVATAYGQRFGTCCFCARELTDSRSVEKGYGPVCADHYGLPWG